jgi:glycerol-3-phosphate acyltransferase PlsX
MRIVVDAMGSDNYPIPDVAGGVLAAREFGDQIILVGQQDMLERELAKHDIKGLSVDIVHAPEAISMQDKPSAVLNSKLQSSIHIGLDLVKTKQADAFVSMGNTGAIHAIATLKTLRRIPGVKRPVLTAIYAITGHNMIFLDIGANADAKAEWLEQFALMGHLYALTALGIHSPRIATLSNGEEEGKGNQLTKEAQERLRENTYGLRYVGHIEPKEILLDKCDVVVMDGFVGNIFLKTFEGSVTYITDFLRAEINQSLTYKLGALLLRGAFRKLRTRLDTREVGGAPLLGVNGVVIIGHGSADSYSVRSAIRLARQAVIGNTIETMTAKFAASRLVADTTS